MPCYSIRKILGGWRVVKFDDLLNVERIHYVRGTLVGTKSCSCYRRWCTVICRHIQMVVIFNTVQRIDKGWFYDWENRRWHVPVSEHFKSIRKRLRRET